MNKDSLGRTEPDVTQVPGDPTPATGDQIADFRLESQLGEGAMGVVYRATEIGLGREVALKLVSPEYTTDSRVRRRLIVEARAAARISHPHAVKIFRAGEADGEVFIAMELIDGRSLASEIRERGPLESKRAFALIARVAEALDAAHAINVIHRDVSPANILLSGAGRRERAVLVDFGISLIGPGTGIGDQAGTPAYMAPERTRGAPGDARSDLYSLACCLQEALTGEPPFVGSREAVTDAHRNEAPPPVSEGAPHAPLGTDLVVTTALSKRPADRYPSTGHFASALHALGNEVLVVSGTGEEAAADALAAGLRDRGHAARSRMLSDDHAVGEVLAHARHCLVVIGRAGLVPEDAAGLVRVTEAPGLEVLVVLRPGAPEPNSPALLGLRALPWLRTRGSATSLAEQMGARLDGLLPTTGAAMNSCPYRGLDPFTEADAELFVGRESEARRLAATVEENRFVAVVGPSGSGKSSLIHAGLVPELTKDHGTTWRWASLTPGTAPLRNLATAAERLGLTLDPARMLENSRYLEEAATGASGQLLVIVDQAEELFTQASADESTALIDNLINASLAPAGPVAVALALRVDFLARCLEHPRLRKVLESSQFLLGPLARDDLVRVIEEPAMRAGLRLEPGVTDAVLADLEGAPTALPLLQYHLYELWRNRQGTTLTLAANAESGGVKGALSRRAEEVYQSLTPDRRTEVEALLLRLVRVPADGPVTRRVLPLDEIPGHGGVGRSAADRLLDARLLAIVDRGGPALDVAHESLVFGWPRFRDLIEDHRDHLQRRSRLADAAIEWERTGREDGLLPRGSALAAWADVDLEDLDQRERTFLLAARDQEGRSAAQARARRRLAVSGVAVLAVLAVVVVALLVGRETAAREARLAEAGQLALAARTELDRPVSERDPELAVALAAASVDRNPAAGGADPLADALDAVAVAQFTPLPGETAVTSVAADGRTLLSAGGEGRVLHQARDGATPARSLTSGVRMPRATAILSSGAIAVGGASGSLELGGNGTAKPLIGHTGDIVALRPLADGRLASADARGGIIIWSPAGQRTRSLQAPGRLRGLAVSSQAEVLAVGTATGEILVSDSPEGSEWRLLGRHRGAVADVAFSPAGELASAGTDGTIRFWALPEGRERRARRIDGFSEGARWLAWGPAGDTVVSLGLTPTGPAVFAWSRDGTLLSSTRTRGARISAATLTPDGKRLIGGMSDGGLRAWKFPAGPVHAERASRPYRSDVAPVADPRSEAVAGLTDDGGVLISRGAGIAPTPVRMGGRTATALALDPFRRRLLVGTSAGELLRIRISDGGQVGAPVRFSRRPIRALAVSPDGLRVAVGAGDVTILVADLGQDGRPERATNIFTGTALNAVTFLEDGRHLVTSDPAGAVIWEEVDGEWRRSRVLPLNSGPARVAATSRDGSMLGLAATGDEAALVWSNESEGVELEATGRSIVAFAFDARGTRIVSLTGDGRLLAHRTRDGVLLRRFPARVRAATVSATPTASGETVGIREDGTILRVSCDLCLPLDALRERARALVQDAAPAELRAAGVDG